MNEERIPWELAHPSWGTKTIEEIDKLMADPEERRIMRDLMTPEVIEKIRALAIASDDHEEDLSGMFQLHGKAIMAQWGLDERQARRALVLMVALLNESLRAEDWNVTLFAGPTSGVEIYHVWLFWTQREGDSALIERLMQETGSGDNPGCP